MYLSSSLSNDSRSSTESRKVLREMSLATVDTIARAGRSSPPRQPCLTYKLPAISGSVEMDASGHAGHAEESFSEMHSAEALPATASNDSNSTPADLRSPTMVLVARLLPPLAGCRGELLLELAAFMVSL